MPRGPGGPGGSRAGDGASSSAATLSSAVPALSRRARASVRRLTAPRRGGYAPRRTFPRSPRHESHRAPGPRHRPLISFEIIPPLRGGDVKGLLAADRRPRQVSAALHRHHQPRRRGDLRGDAAAGIQRRVKRKRPGTLGVCALIQNKYDIDAVPHILCRGFTREETEDFLIELNYLGIDNVLAVRGDDSGYQKPLQHGRSANHYAVDLVRQIDGHEPRPLPRAGPARRRAVELLRRRRRLPREALRGPQSRSPTSRGVKEKVDAGARLRRHPDVLRQPALLRTTSTSAAPPGSRCRSSRASRSSTARAS